MDNRPEWYFFKEMFYAFVCCLWGGFVVKHEQHPRENLDKKEKKGQPSKKVPEGMFMVRYSLPAEIIDQGIKMKALVNPRKKSFSENYTRKD